MCTHLLVHVADLNLHCAYMYMNSGNVHELTNRNSLFFSFYIPPPSPLSLSVSLSLSLSLSLALQSAIAKEQELENKLASMQSVINAARELASDSMIVSVPPPGLVSCRVTCVL